MNKKIIYSTLLCCFFINPAQAVCVNNQTSSTLYYEIYNKNTGCPIPKERFHSGTLSSNEKRCHAHSDSAGDDWKIYRKDVIQVYKIDPHTNKKEIVCDKNVNGIINTLDVDFVANQWWCLDRSDYED